MLIDTVVFDEPGDSRRMTSEEQPKADAKQSPEATPEPVEAETLETPIDVANVPPPISYIQVEIPIFKTLMPSPEAPILLAIDTCTLRSSVAIRDAYVLRAECSWESDRHHTAAVSAQIQRLLQSCEITPEQLGAVAVATGPGSFTGVRCGMAIAKGIATARSLPLIGVSAFDVVAAAQPNLGIPIYTLVEIGRARVGVCRYEWQESQNQPRIAGEWRIQSWQEFAAAVEAPAWVCGDVSPKLALLLDKRIRIAPATLNLRRAGYLAEVGYARWQNAETDNPMTLIPIYPAETV
jgi:tRNA threonylcarbamoyladenosine biosynthesis protein TsaB